MDLAGALGRPLAQSALELLERRVDEDRQRAGDPLLDGEGSVQFQLEQRDVACGGDPVELRDERAGALAPGEDVVLEEAAVGEQAVELLVAQVPVVDALDLARPQRPRRRRDGEPKPRDAGQ